MQSSQTNILIAEDDPAFRHVIQFTLKREGYNVIAVGDGNAAFDRLTRGDIDFVITDQQMPMCTGMEMLERRIGHPYAENVPAILCSAKGFELDVEAVKAKYGLIEVVNKPFSPRKLVGLISSNLERANLEKTRLEKVSLEHQAVASNG